jgi:hypothetical protein
VDKIVHTGDERGEPTLHFSIRFFIDGFEVDNVLYKGHPPGRFSRWAPNYNIMINNDPSLVWNNTSEICL